MTTQTPPELTSQQKLWSLAAAVLFLSAIGFLGFALNTGVLRAFAVGWVVLQMFGYIGALRFAQGDPAHPLFKSQVMLHVIAATLLAATIWRAL